MTREKEVNDLIKEIENLLQEKEKIGAIKLLRQRTWSEIYLGLKDAKEVVEIIDSEMKLRNGEIVSSAPYAGNFIHGNPRTMEGIKAMIGELLDEQLASKIENKGW